MSLAFYKKLDAFPPLVCRLLARVTMANGKSRALRDEEIAGHSGLTLPEVRSLSWRTDWNDVSLSDFLKFTTGCNVIFDSRNSMRAHRSYIKNSPKFSYLRRSPEWEHVYQPMVMAYVKHLSK